jgi:hypothetical protein
MSGITPSGFSKFYRPLSDPFPPPNPSLRWFRVVFWLMPTCLVFTTFLALGPLASMVGGPFLFWLIGWLWVNFAATYALGVIDQKLSGRSPAPEEDAFASEVAAFVGLQVILVPSVLVAMWLGALWILG